MTASRTPRTVARTKPKPNRRKRTERLDFVRHLPCVARPVPIALSHLVPVFLGDGLNAG
jgi:hypothetical protein